MGVHPLVWVCVLRQVSVMRQGRAGLPSRSMLVMDSSWRGRVSVWACERAIVGGVEAYVAPSKRTCAFANTNKAAQSCG